MTCASFPMILECYLRFNLFSRGIAQNRDPYIALAGARFKTNQINLNSYVTNKISNQSEKSLVSVLKPCRVWRGLIATDIVKRGQEPEQLVKDADASSLTHFIEVLEDVFVPRPNVFSPACLLSSGPSLVSITTTAAAAGLRAKGPTCVDYRQIIHSSQQ